MSKHENLSWFGFADFIRSVLFIVLVYLIILIYNKGGFLYAAIKRKTLSFIIRLPSVSSNVKKELGNAEIEIRNTLHKPYGDLPFLERLPFNGLDYKEVISLSQKYKSIGTDGLYDGKISGCLYLEPQKDLDLIHLEIFKLYAYANPLHPDLFPGLMKMEAEIVTMCCELYGGDIERCCGTVTSGGTESILLACLAYRNFAKKTKGVKRPEIILGESAHVAFNKACEYFGIVCVTVPLDPKSLAMNVTGIESYITQNTIAIVASAPSFPHGIIDPISEIAQIGIKYGVPVHVDCCLGGFLMPFTFEAEFDDMGITKFLMCEGITSISADTHKYGFTPKGSSVILYSDKPYLHAQYYVSTDWMGGMYPSATLLGSRSGLNIALAWATLCYFGKRGYVESTKKIITTCREIIRCIREKEVEPRKVEFEIMGDPKLNVVAICNAPDSLYDVYHLGQKMSDKGWNLNYLQNPHGLHLCVTHVHTKDGVAQGFINDLVESDKELKLDREVDGKDFKKDTSVGALYCFAQSISDQTPVRDVIINGYLDGYYGRPQQRG